MSKYFLKKSLFLFLFLTFFRLSFYDPYFFFFCILYLFLLSRGCLNKKRTGLLLCLTLKNSYFVSSFLIWIIVDLFFFNFVCFLYICFLLISMNFHIIIKFIIKQFYILQDTKWIQGYQFQKLLKSSQFKNYEYAHLADSYFLI